ncbi:FHA domain-containing protein [Haliangium sp.]|uniref:FHA domain-containing protein n=1 Tax=Haliangium sp. TaxID=2663208 RepID=UPI003D114FFD
MASLEHLASGTVHELTANHLVGRVPQNHLQIDDPLVSGRHAEFVWTGSCWEVRDLGSKNGTFAGMSQIERITRVTLCQDMRLAFGNQENLYVVRDDSPPRAMATCDDGRVVTAEDGILVLPDPEHPAYTVFDEAAGRWLAESGDGERRAVANEDVLVIDDHAWRLELPHITESTWQHEPDQLLLHTMTLHLAVSRDEEHVQMTLSTSHRTVKLKTSAHGYLVLTLARARLEDAADPEISSDEAGWLYVSDLVDQLKTNPNQLNVAIFRARQQVARAGVMHATDLFERRPNTRQIRLGLRRIEIELI